MNCILTFWCWGNGKWDGETMHTPVTQSHRHTHIYTGKILITHTHSTTHNIIWVKVKDNAAGVLSLERIAALLFCAIASGLMSNNVVDNRSKHHWTGSFAIWVPLHSVEKIDNNHTFDCGCDARSFIFFASLNPSNRNGIINFGKSTEKKHCINS